MNSTLIMLQYSSSNFPSKTVISTPQNFSENSLMRKAVEVQKADGFYILSRCRESQRSIEIGPKLVVLHLFDSKATHCPAQYSKDFFFLSISKDIFGISAVIDKVACFQTLFININ